MLLLRNIIKKLHDMIFSKEMVSSLVVQFRLHINSRSSSNQLLEIQKLSSGFHAANVAVIFFSKRKSAVEVEVQV